MAGQSNNIILVLIQIVFICVKYNSCIRDMYCLNVEIVGFSVTVLCLAIFSIQGYYESGRENVRASLFRMHLFT